MRRRAWAGLFVLAFLPLAARAGEEPGGSPVPLTLTVGEGGLTIQGATPDSEVSWFGVEREIDADFSIGRRSREGQTVAGPDGVAVVPLVPPPAGQAVWVVAEVGTGRYVAGTKDDYVLSWLPGEKTPCRGEIGAGEAGEDQLLDDREQIEGFMVRPGQGVWRFSGGDGGPDDADQAPDGRIHLVQAQFRPLGSAPAAPARIAAQDLWFVVDPMTLDFSVLLGGVAQ